MRIPSSRNVRLLVAVCLVVGVGAVATVVQASIGGIGGGGVIQGCYDSGGNVKVVAALPCPKGYTALQWNQTGPTGGTGPTGASGATGATGPRGPADLPPVGAFTPTQLVQGAILTCATINTTVADSTCSGLQLNGEDIEFTIDGANRICKTITGGQFDVGAAGGEAANPHFTWNGTSWTLSSSPAALLGILGCAL